MTPGLRIRCGRASDVESIAALHADSWRRTYRGTYADDFLDGDLVSDRRAVWQARLAADDRGDGVTEVVEASGRVIAFVHVIPDEHPHWGSLIDNLHVLQTWQRQGVGTRLARRAAEVATSHRTGMHLWVQQQNHRAIGFYRARGAREVERAAITPPGQIRGRLVGSPQKLRYAWTLQDLTDLDTNDARDSRRLTADRSHLNPTTGGNDR